MNYAISAGHEKTLESAQDILESGGNAFDAAISAYFTSFVAEPCMASAGAGGFANIYTEQGLTFCADFFCQTPVKKYGAATNGLIPIEVDFGSSKELFYAGASAMAVPGAIKFIYELHEKYGSLPMTVLMQHARHYAKNGIKLNTFQAIDLNLLEKIFRMDKSVRNVFFKEDNSLKLEGDVIHMSDYDLFLDALASDGVDLFYKGEIADIIDSYSRINQGHIRKIDFESYHVHWDQSLRISFDNSIVLVPPRSSTGSWIMANILSELNKVLNDQWQNDYLSIVKDLVALPGGYECFKSRFQKLSLSSDEAHNNQAYGGTSHFNIVDQWGNAIALTTTIGEGNGYFIPGTMMQMNNMLGETALQPDGLGTWTPGSRLNSMMTPSIILDDQKRLRACLGSGGAARIPYVITQVLLYILRSGYSLENSIAAPRLYLSKSGNHVESGFMINSDKLDQAQRWTKPSLFFGGVHGIQVDNQGIFHSCGDHRRYGVSFSK